jgi:hypothetical protein
MSRRTFVKKCGSVPPTTLERIRNPLKGSGSGGKRCEDFVEVNRSAFHREDPENPRRSIEVVGHTQEVDDPMEPALSHTFDPPTLPFQEEVQIEHLLLDRVVDHDLTGGESQDFGEGILRNPSPDRVLRNPLRKQLAFKLGRRDLTGAFREAPMAEVGDPALSDSTRIGVLRCEGSILNSVEEILVRRSDQLCGV